MRQDDYERFKNGLIHKMWVTDKERDEILSNPLYWAMLVGIIAFLLAVGTCTGS